MAGIAAKHRNKMKFCNSHLTGNIFNLNMRRFFFGLVYSFLSSGMKQFSIHLWNW